ncbi:MAG: glycosyltransferase family 2 protein [Candidatus Paceibacterota bacterium]
MTDKKSLFISIVVPVYNEAENILPLLKNLIPIVKSDEYEIIFVDDGSTDSSTDLIKNQAAKNKCIKLLSFQRNFGHQIALTAGYHASRGDLVISLDADMQDPPELIPQMIKKWKAGAKIVYARRSGREESFFKRITANVFYSLINSLSSTPIPHEVGDFRLLDREIVNVLNNMPEQARFLRGLVAWGGFKAAYVDFERKPRNAGETHYPFSKMVSFALDGITSFSTKPLRFATYLGFLTSVFGVIGIIYALYRRLFLSPEYWVPGWTATFVAIMFFGGVQLITIGIIGEYIGNLYKQAQDRPLYIVKEKVNMK